jgi:GTP-binding protein
MTTVSSAAAPRPWIAIVGRPNVGKSTLFNRLIGARKAVVSSSRGTTRDRLYGRAEWQGTAVTLIDAGGMEFTTAEGLAGGVQRQVGQAVRDADAFLFVCDAKAGLLPADQMIMERLRTAGKPVVAVLNKLDDRLAVPAEFFTLGLPDPLPVSALHGLGIGELLDRLVQMSGQPPALRAVGPEGAASLPAVAIAIVGRQNVGKSSLVNALLREERVIVNEQPGTTRDAVDTHLMVEGRSVRLVDTAGLRHRRKVHDPVDTFSMSRTLEAVSRCDVVAVLLDATQGVTRDDRRIVDRVCQSGRGLVLLINKWDLIKGRQERLLADAVHRALPFASFAPVLAMSAKTGFQVRQGLTLMLRIARAMRQAIPEAECAALLQRAWAAQPPPRCQGRALRLKQARWVPGNPGRMEVMTQPVKPLPGPYHRYLLKALQAHPSLTGSPLQLIVNPSTPRSLHYPRPRRFRARRVS